MCQIFLRSHISHTLSPESALGLVQLAVVRRYPYATSLASRKIKKFLCGLCDEIWLSHRTATLSHGIAEVILTPGRFEADREDWGRPEPSEPAGPAPEVVVIALLRGNSVPASDFL